jgi:hypothetical protein
MWIVLCILKQSNNLSVARRNAIEEDFIIAMIPFHFHKYATRNMEYHVTIIPLTRK